MFACQHCFLCEHDDKKLAVGQVRASGKGRGKSSQNAGMGGERKAMGGSNRKRLG